MDSRLHRLASGCALAAWLTALPASAGDKPQPCIGIRPDTLEGLICSDRELLRLDRQLTWNYRRAFDALDYLRQLDLTDLDLRRQRERLRCWHVPDQRQCLADDYRRRIAELQALYSLLPVDGAYWLICSDRARTRLSATFYPSNPASLRIEFDGKPQVLLRETAASGLLYRSEQLQFHQQDQQIRLRWPGSAGEQDCRLNPR
jgi:uncharacterized protein